MSLIDNIVDINITRSTIGITSAGFDTLLIIGTTEGSTRVKSYSSITEVVADYATTTDEYKAASLAFGQSTKLNKILIGQVLGGETFEEAYPLITQENNDFYGVMLATKDTDMQLKVAGLIETDSKIFGITSNDVKTLDSNDTTHILDQLKNLNYTRTFVVYNSKAAAGIFPEAAWFGLMLSKDPGSATWAYKSLSGFEADNLSSSNISAIKSKNGNYFVPLSGKDIMLNGAVVSGEYIDIVQGLDFVTDDLKTQIGNALILSDKIPFTNTGIAIIESMVRNSLMRAADKDILDRETIKVSVPDVRNISQSDKQARKLPDVTFEARLAGAIHNIKIQGIVTL